MKLGTEFLSLIDRAAPDRSMGRTLPDARLLQLLGLCIPYADRIFTGRNATIKILHHADYAMEKAFVWALLSLDKWFSFYNLDDLFPPLRGGWPPTYPADLVPEEELPEQ